MSLRVWRNQIVEVWRTTDRGYRFVRYPQPYAPVADYCDRVLTYDAFTAGPSDYDVPSDEIYCPCGAVLPWGGDIGEAVRRIDDHCRSTVGHPMPSWAEAY